MANRQTYTRIHGVSEIRRMPRLGKIRLGIKKRSERTGKEYPVEVPYFVCPPEVVAVFGPQPTELRIMLPTEDELAVFPQSLKWYDRSSTDPLSSVILRCKGDKQTAIRRVMDLREGEAKPIEQVPADPKAYVSVSCPCKLLDDRSCRQMGNLMVVLPEVSVGAVYQVDTGSTNNLITINSYFDYLRGTVGRISWVPLVLRRIQGEVVDPDGKRRKHYLLQLELAVSLKDVAALRERTTLVLTQTRGIALPAPVEDGPDTAPGAIIDVEPEPEEENGETSPEQVSPEAPRPAEGGAHGVAADSPDRPGARDQDGSPGPTPDPQAPAEKGGWTQTKKAILQALGEAKTVDQLERTWARNASVLTEMGATDQAIFREAYLTRKEQLADKGKRGR